MVRTAEQHDISNFKLHKAASTTISSVLFRYAARHGRKIVMGEHQGGCWPQQRAIARNDPLHGSYWDWAYDPKTYLPGPNKLQKQNNLSHPAPVMEYLKTISRLSNVGLANPPTSDPLEISGWCTGRGDASSGLDSRGPIDMGDISINHIVEEANPSTTYTFSDVLAYYHLHTPNAKLITSVRKPAAHLWSYLRYFNNQGDADWETVIKEKGPKGKEANHEALELGVRTKADVEELKNALRDGVLAMCVVVERFAESMLLLRKVGRWDLIDVTAVHLNHNKDGRAEIPSDFEQQANQLLELDMLVYNACTDHLDGLKAKYYPDPADFASDLDSYQRMNTAVSDIVAASYESTEGKPVVGTSQLVARFYRIDDELGDAVAGAWAGLPFSPRFAYPECGGSSEVNCGKNGDPPEHWTSCFEGKPRSSCCHSSYCAAAWRAWEGESGGRKARLAHWADAVSRREKPKAIGEQAWP